MNEAELILTEVLKCKRAELYLNRSRILSEQNSRFIASVLRRRVKGEPLQYILGKSEFMGLEFKVAPGVLIPRPETEILVEGIIKIFPKIQDKNTVVQVLDMCTGSGCIAVSLAKLLSGIHVTAADISEAALQIARENACACGASEKISFIQSDLFISSKLIRGGYDIIVANPPYVPTGEICRLQPEISFEPAIALDGGIDGLGFYRKIIGNAYFYLKANGILVLEAGSGQVNSIKNIFQNSGKFEIIDILRDYNGVDRVIVAGKL